jgi:hypothetical protein
MTGRQAAAPALVRVPTSLPALRRSMMGAPWTKTTADLDRPRKRPAQARAMSAKCSSYLSGRAPDLDRPAWWAECAAPTQAMTPRSTRWPLGRKETSRYSPHSPLHPRVVPRRKADKNAINTKGTPHGSRSVRAEAGRSTGIAPLRRSMRRPQLSVVYTSNPRKFAQGEPIRRIGEIRKPISLIGSETGEPDNSAESGGCIRQHN